MESIERLRVVKNISERFLGKEDAQAKAIDALSALVNLVSGQIAHFAILKSRTTVEQGLGASQNWL